PKVLWDKIVTYFAAKTVENSANALDKLFDTQFNEGEIEKSVNLFRAAFRRLVEVSSKFDKKSLEAVAVVFALKRLPMSFSVFHQLQFAGFKDDNISFNDFLRDLEVEGAGGHPTHQCGQFLPQSKEKGATTLLL
ncbi:uncharacterized protein VP01_13884g1, partial [Puccinia sorghi]